MLKSNINDAVILAFSIVIIGYCFGPIHVFGLDFSYAGKSGPAMKGHHDSLCVGKYERPLNTVFYETVDKQFPYFNMTGFDKPANSAEFINNGETIFLNLTYEAPPLIHGGPLHTIYTFAHLNFYWGSIDAYEHHVATAELHLVFYNVMYFSFSDASEYDDGIAVMSFLYTANSSENHNYNALIGLLSQVREPKMRVSFLQPPNLKGLITNNHSSYLTYKGTLITHPCSRNVTWMDFEDAINLSRAQYIELGNYLKHQTIKQNPVQEADIYKHVQKYEGITNRANYHYLIVIETWFILLQFGIFIILSTM